MLIRYHGHIGEQTGYGHAAREFCMSLLAAGIPDLQLQINPLAPGQGIPPRYAALVPYLVDADKLSVSPDVCIIHTLPLSCGEGGRQAAERLRPTGTKLVAYTTWEGAESPSEGVREMLSIFDEVWFPNEDTVNAIDPRRARFGGTHVFPIPHSYDEGAPWGRSAAEARARRFGRRGPYTFYYIGAWTARKNVEGLIRAFMWAFDNESPVQLILQCAGAAPAAAQLAMFGSGVPRERWPSVHFSSDPVSDERLTELHLGSDCFVTASRGEGWCLPAFEAMLHGNHIIAPEGLGCDDYLHDTSATLFSAELAPSHGEIRMKHVDASGGATAEYLGAQGMSARDTWREPNLHELGGAMRDAFRSRRDRAGLRVHYDIASRYGRPAVGALIKARLEDIIGRK